MGHCFLYQCIPLSFRSPDLSHFGDEWAPEMVSNSSYRRAKQSIVSATDYGQPTWDLWLLRTKASINSSRLWYSFIIVEIRWNSSEHKLWHGNVFHNRFSREFFIIITAKTVENTAFFLSLETARKKRRMWAHEVGWQGFFSLEGFFWILLGAGLTGAETRAICQRGI